jgi:hypothetical protein
MLAAPHDDTAGAQPRSRASSRANSGETSFWLWIFPFAVQQIFVLQKLYKPR